MRRQAVIAGLAAAAALGAPSVNVPQAGKVMVGGIQVPSAPGMGSAMAKLLAAFSNGISGDGAWKPRPPHFNRHRSVTVAEAKRRARKRRNVLRSKGHFRKAVR